jgi:hypothetical protein
MFMRNLLVFGLIFSINFFPMQMAFAETTVGSIETKAASLETKSITLEAVKRSNTLQEMDITFWQTMPFATLWTYLAERQISGAINPAMTTHWEIILPLAAVVSITNAWYYTHKVPPPNE